MAEILDASDPYASPAGALREVDESLRGSRAGWISFWIAIVTVPLILGAVALGIYFVARVEGNIADDAPELLTLGFAVLGCMAVQFVGIVLGIVGAVRRGPRRVFAWIGLTCNALMFSCFVGMLLFADSLPE